jgi:hypothetical protein
VTEVRVYRLSIYSHSKFPLVPANKDLRDAGYLIAAAAAAVSLIANLAVSGFTVDLVVDAVNAAKPSQATVQDVVTVATVFGASAPVVLAVLACFIIHKETELRGIPEILAFAAVWYSAGWISYTVLFPGEGSVAVVAGSTPPALLLRSILWALTPYGAVLAGQGIAVGVAAGIGYLHFTNPERHQNGGDDS